MLHPPRKTARIQLTSEQIEAIRRQTGLDHIPDIVSFSIDTLVHKQTINCSASQAPETERGLIHEINRI